MGTVKCKLIEEVSEYWQLLGYQKGFQEGFLEGFQEESQDFLSTVARKALRRGMTPEVISELTSLSIEEIEKLSRDLENDLVTNTQLGHS